MEWFIGIWALGACAMACVMAYIATSEEWRATRGYEFIGMAILWPATMAWLAFSRHPAWGGVPRGRRARPPHAYRWSDNDRYWWRFTYANENRPDGRGREERRIFGLYLTSKGDEDDGSFCLLRAQLLGRTLILRLPAMFEPAREWVDTSHYQWSTNPAGGYWDVHERSYGFLFVEGRLHVDYGAQTGDSSTDHGKVYFLPWRSWRHVRFSLYGLDGEHIWSQFDKDRPKPRPMGSPPEPWNESPIARWHDQQRAAQDAAPCCSFEFLDFDKTRITARTQINEREWHLGEGWFRWLSWFAKPKVRRSLDIQFSEETGRRKGSWKGGTIGHSIDMLMGETHRHAFARYCKMNQMTFPAPDKPLRVEPQDMASFVNPRGGAFLL